MTERLFQFFIQYLQNHKKFQTKHMEFSLLYDALILRKLILECKMDL